MKIAVFGAGTMGLGIAQVFAGNYENDVLLCSSAIESAQRGKDKLTKQLMNRVEKGKMDIKEAEELLSRINVATAASCADRELIVEAIPEDMTKKKDLLFELDGICNSNCIFASNTSSISISELSKGLKRNVIGMHFFNPAPVMKLVEVVYDANISDETINAICDIAEKHGKTPVRVKNSPGFVVNRLLIPMINEAAELYADGIAAAEDIDAAMKLGANHPMGPLALADLIGIDVCLAIMITIQKETGNTKYTPSKQLIKMVDAGKLGRKTGEGFYKY